MLITWADVVKIDALLASVDVDAQTWFLAHVNTALDIRRFDGEGDPRLRLARLYLAAHFGTIALTGVGGAGAAGPVTSEAAGSLSRSYASITSSSSDPLLDTTSWGRLYRMLIRPAGGGCVL